MVLSRYFFLISNFYSKPDTPENNENLIMEGLFTLSIFIEMNGELILI